MERRDLAVCSASNYMEGGSEMTKVPIHFKTAKLGKEAIP
jgi:hypothetical protein